MEVEVIYGPPGTGKTSELLKRIQRLCDSGVVESDICFVSFTKAAAKEMADRAGLSKANISTIHSLAYRMLNLSKDQIISREELKQFSKITGFEFTGTNPEEQEFLGVGDFYLSLYSLYKNLLHEHPKQTFNISNREGSLKEFEFFVKKYDEFKRAFGVFDFTDMLKKALDEDAPNFKYIFIDEAQDLSPLQWELIEHWARWIPKVCVAGDDDQALYKWGGADPAGMFNFAKKFGANSIVLGQSYRVPLRVHELAVALVSNIKDRVDKKYLPRKDFGIVRKFDSVFTIPTPRHGDDVLFLYRNHSLRDDFEQILIDNGLPYVIDSGRPGYFHSPLARAARLFKTAVRDFENTGRVFIRGNEENLLCKFCPKYRNHIQKGDFSFVSGRSWVKFLIGPVEQTRYLEQVDSDNNLFAEPTIHMSTIHGSKGREAERVVLLNALGGRSLDTFTVDPDSEIRNFYVGVTRSKNTLDIVYGRNALNYF